MKWSADRLWWREAPRYVVYLVLSTAILVLSLAVFGKDLNIPGLPSSSVVIGSLDNWLSLSSRQLFSLVFFSPILFLALFLLKRLNGSHDRDSVVNQNKMSTHQLMLAVPICVVVVTFVLSYRFVMRASPQGGDTPQYVFITNLLSQKFDLGIIVGDGRELTYLIILLVRLVVERVLGFTFRESMMVIPVLFGTVFCLAVFHFIRKLTRDDGLAIYALLASGLSIFLIRTSIDLFAQLVGLSLATLFLAEFLDGGRALVMIALNLLLILADFYLWVFVVGIVGIYWVLTIFLREKTIMQDLRRAVVAFLPGLLWIGIVSLIGAMNLLNIPSQWYERSLGPPTFLSGILFPFTTGETTLLNLPGGWDWLAGWESPYIVILAVFGIISIIMRVRESSYHRLVLGWTFAPTLVLIVTGYVQAYRALLLIPVGILAAHGLSAFANLITHSLRPLDLHFKNVNSRRFLLSPKLLFSVVVILLILNSAVSRAYIALYVYYPNEKGVNQLIQIKNIYGFGNLSVLILVEVDKDSAENRFQWARALTGTYVYVGNLSQLFLTGSFEYNHVEVNLNPLLFKTIVIPSALYNVTVVESAIAKEVVPGILVINMGGH